MLRKIYLNGEMSNKFGTVHPFAGDTAQEAVRLLSSNFPDFRTYLIDCMENGIQFSVSVHGDKLEDIKECLLPLKEGDIIITPIPAGSKSGGAKILTAVAIAALLLIPGGQALVGGTGGNLFAAMTATGAPAWQTYLAYSAAMLSLNLATTGIQQLMAPDPSVDEKDDPGYMISGVSQNVVEGDPIPLLYGELRVPGRPISFEIKNKTAKIKSEMSSITGANVPIHVNDAITSGAHSSTGEMGPGVVHAGTLEAVYAHNESVERDTLAGVNTIYGKSQNILVTDVISEGPIYGLVNGSSSVYLNDDSAMSEGEAARSLSRTAASFTLTNGSTSVTYNGNGQTALIDIVGTRYINLRAVSYTHLTLPTNREV